MKMQKLGGYLCFASIFLLIFIYMIVPALGFKSINEFTDPIEAINTFNDYSIFYKICSQATPIFVAIFYVVFTMTLRERMHAKAPNLMNFAVIAAVIAAIAPFLSSMVQNSMVELIAKSKDVSSFNLTKGIQSGFGSASMHGFGWVGLLTGIAAVKTKMLPKTLGYLLIIGGVNGVLNFALPPFPLPFQMIFIIITFINFTWLGIYLIRYPDPKIE